MGPGLICSYKTQKKSISLWHEPLLYTTIHLYFYTSIHLYFYTSIHLYIYTSIHHIVKLGFTGVYIIFLISAQNIYFCSKHLLYIYTSILLYIYTSILLYFYTSIHHIVKLGFTGVYIIFLISAQNIDCGYSLGPPRRHNLWFEEKYEKYQKILSENFHFLW